MKSCVRHNNHLVCLESRKSAPHAQEHGACVIDWCDDNYIDGFIYYKRTWYHVSEFVRTPDHDEWHGYKGDSFFSGVLIRLSNDGEQYRIATFIQ